MADSPYFGRPGAPNFSPASTVWGSYGDAGRNNAAMMKTGMDALTMVQQRRDQTKALRQVVKSYAPEGDAGEALTAWSETAGLGDLEGFVKGQVAQTDQAMAKAKMEDVAAQTQQRLRDTKDAEVLQQVWKSYGEETDPTKVAPSDFLSRFMKAGGSPYGLEKAGQFFKDITNQGPDAENPLQFDTTSIPGNTIVKTKRGAGFQVVPTVDAGEGPKISPDGNYYHNGKTWVHVKQSGAPAGSKFVNINGAVALMSPDNRILDWKMENPQTAFLNAVTGGSKTNQPAAAPSKKAARTAQGGYTVGTVYKGGMKYLGGDPMDTASWEKQ